MAASGSGSGSGGGSVEHTLDETMRAPSATEPEVVVVTEVPDVATVVEEEKRVIVLDPKSDLWVSNVDGRHQSPIIPLYVGHPTPSTFYVHRAILTKTDYFSTALNGAFQETASQSISLPEEDPAIFHFLVAFLYEGTFIPVKTLSSVLVPEPEKGKGKELDAVEESAAVDDNSSSTDSGSGSDDSARSRRMVEVRRRRQQRLWEERNRKELGRHRPDCTCANCVVDMQGPPCWNCGQPRTRASGQSYPGAPPYWFQPAPPGPPPHPHPHQHQYPNQNQNNIIYIHEDRLNVNIQRHRGLPPPILPLLNFNPEPRMSPEDLRTWLLTLNLAISVFICADKYLFSTLKVEVAAWVTNAFETAGQQAAHPDILHECSRLWEAIGDRDELVKMVLARTGFLMGKLWKEHAEATMEWWGKHGEVAARIMMEMGERREVELCGTGHLPPMRRLGRPPPPPASPPRARRRR